MISFIQARTEDAPLIQKILECSPGYYQKTEGSEVFPGLGLKELTDCPAPEKRSDSYQKIFLIAYQDNHPIGVVDLHKDHPVQGSTYLGLLLLDEKFHGKGLGKEVYQAAEKFIGSELKSSIVKLGVSHRNEVFGFWQKMGFAPNGRVYKWQGALLESEVTEMEKKLN